MNKKVYAHRGGSGYRIENSLAAFDFALELEIDGAELDVQLTKDQEVIVHHNNKLNHNYTKKQNGDWLLKSEEIVFRELTLKEIKKFMIGEANLNLSYYKQFPELVSIANQCIPTLKEVIELVQSKSSTFQLIIEIKSDLFSIDEKNWKVLTDKVLKIVNDLNFINRVVFCSFDWRCLKYIIKKNKNYNTAFLTHPFGWYDENYSNQYTLKANFHIIEKYRKAWKNKNLPWFTENLPKTFKDFPNKVAECGGDIWYCYYGDMDNELSEKTHMINLKCYVWTVNVRDFKEKKFLNSLNVDAQCVDYFETP